MQCYEELARISRQKTTITQIVNAQIVIILANARLFAEDLTDTINPLYHQSQEARVKFLCVYYDDV